MADFEYVSCMRGYHVHRYIWDAVVGESLICRREPLNPRDKYAVAVIEKFRVYNLILLKNFCEFNFCGLRVPTKIF